MAYFSNSTEGAVFDNECSECVLGEKMCPIALVQMSYNYKALGNPTASVILNALVKQKENGEYCGCQLKPLLSGHDIPGQMKMFGDDK